MNSNNTEVLPVHTFTPSIFTVRGQLVLLASDLAAFYGITRTHFHEQLKRNLTCLPADFMFQLSVEEVRTHAAQFATSDTCEDGLPHAFTEHGVLMAAMVLDTPRAMDIGAQVVRAFIQMREEVGQLLASDNGLAVSILQLERRIESHDFIVGILQTLCHIVKAPGALHLTEAQRAELSRLLEEYEKSQEAGSPWPEAKERILKRG